MSIYSRARKHINMERVKELKEEKHIAELKKQQEIVLVELSKLSKEKNKHYDWRTGKDLTETMVTTGALETVLPAEGDVDLENIVKSAEPGTSESGGSGGTYSYGDYNGAGTAGFSIVLDSTKFDTIKFTANPGNADRIELSVGTNPISYITLSSGTNVIHIKSSSRTKSTRFVFNAVKDGAVSGSTGAQVSGLVFQRRTPISAFVGLDDPDASAFLRDGQLDNLSPGEKKKKLEEQLASSKEYLNKMFGEGMPNTATTIADYEPQKSYTEIASIYQSPDGTYQSFPGSVNPNKDTSKWPSINDKPKPVKWPTPGIFPGQLPRV